MAAQRLKESLQSADRLIVAGPKDAALNQRQIKKFQELLETRRQELLAEAGRTVGGMSRSKEEFPDPTDRASLEAARNAMLRIRDRERKLISKIDEALERIEAGNYGLCRGCGEPISVDRLMVRPVTTLCIECKADEEQEERRRHR
ncbi:MAG TPA: RNA polymerase-binding protein DksA [Terriglobales bacterium]|nr:RNA polymerase-binding protein DksA [Terriglobales bacterium]